MKVQGLSPQTDERFDDLQPTLLWKQYISSAVISVRAAHGDGGETLEAKGQIFDVAAADSTAAPPICKAGAD